MGTPSFTKHLSYVLCFCWLLMRCVESAQADILRSVGTGAEIVARHAITLNEPVGEPTQYMPKGPLLGNGDIGVMQSGSAEQLIYTIGKNDFWSIKRQSPITVGQLRLLIPALQGAEFQTVSDMRLAELRGNYTKGAYAMTSRAWADANHNLLCVELSNTGSKPLFVSTVVSMGAAAAVPVSVPANDNPVKIGCEQHGGGRWFFTGEIADVQILDRALGHAEISALAPVTGGAFLYDPDAPEAVGRKIGVATRVLGTDSPSPFTLAPGASAVVATAILSDLDAKGANPLASAQAMLASLTKEKVAANTAAHRTWWNDFWNRSFIEIPDKTIEQCWYASWYVMGSCSRAGKVAPGLWGNWLTVDNPAWHGDFHMNYNFQAPFYGLYSANHAETTLPFYDALNQSIPRGKKIAAAKGWKGIHLPVSLGPWGMCPEGEDCDWGQRSNAAYAALLYIWHWQHTLDKDWLKTTGYEFLRETAAFWEDYLTFENNRYVITNDSIHEGSGPDMNGLLSLGLVKTLFRNMIPLSEALGVDADKRAKWRDIAEKISDFPLQERDGKTVFRYTEKGTAWWNDNTLGIQHIFPAGAIGLGSDPKLLEISHNMINAMGRWRDFNGSSSWYAACARVGYDPKKMLAELNNMYTHHALPNKLLNFGGGGIENVSPALGVTEMLLQSHEGVIRLFPCWPKELDARFGTLRAVGAFLVSAELKGGVTGNVKIVSEKGCCCTIQNPWPGKTVRVIRNGKKAETLTGERLTLKTSVGETLGLAPVGNE